MNTQKQIFLMVVLFFVLVGGCASYTFIEPIRAERQDDFFQAESIRRGALLYANNCRTCHGNEGQGGVGLPLNIPEFKNQDPLVLEANKELIRRTLYCGRAGTRMPPWLNENGGSLTDTQIEHIINFLTAPVTELEDGEPARIPNLGWEEAVEFAHNLNHEASAVVGGDTLDTIADAHRIGIAELADHLGVDPTTRLPDEEVVSLPAPLDGRSFEVDSDAGLTVADIAASVHLGAAMIAELNDIEYEITEEFDFVLLEDGEEVTGLFPGTELALPGEPQYLVVAGDTLDSIAAMHNISVAEVRGLNGSLPADSSVAIESRNALQLPPGTTMTVGQTLTLDAIAGLHLVGPPDGSELEELDVEVLAELNGLDPEAQIEPGATLELPENTHRIVQVDETVGSIVAPYSEPEVVKALNDLEAAGDNQVLPTSVILQLPPVDAYVVQGQDLEDVADGLEGTNAGAVAEANDLSGPDAVVRVGTPLAYPEDAWGAAAPDTITAATVCVQYAVPQSVYETLPGVGDGGAGGPAQPVEDFAGTIVGESSTFDVAAFEVPPATEITLTFDNQDENVPHNFAIFESPQPGDGDLLSGCTEGCEDDDVRTAVEPGPIEQRFTFTTPGEEGEYGYWCEVHPTTMTGTMIVREGAPLPGEASGEGEGG